MSLVNIKAPKNWAYATLSPWRPALVLLSGWNWLGPSPATQRAPAIPFSASDLPATPRKTVGRQTPLPPLLHFSFWENLRCLGKYWKYVQHNSLEINGGHKSWKFHLDLVSLGPQNFKHFNFLIKSHIFDWISKLWKFFKSLTHASKKWKGLRSNTFFF